MKHAAPTSGKSLRQRAAARLRRPPRLSGWFAIAIALAALVWAIAPQQLPVSLYKLSLVTLAGVVGYWLDRSMFPYARPDDFLPDSQRAQDLADAAGERSCAMLVAPEESLLRLAGAAMLRRALIVAATMLAMGLGA